VAVDGGLVVGVGGVVGTEVEVVLAVDVVVVDDVVEAAVDDVGDEDFPHPTHIKAIPSVETMRSRERVIICKA
jgi:hypothetical protein